MATTTAHRRNRQSSGPAAYLCWSHDNNRMEMTDLPGYLDSLQRSYDSVQQAYTSMATAMPAAPAWGVPAPSVRPRPHTKGRPHSHGEGCDCDAACGCGDRDRDCSCGGRERDCACGGRERDCGCGSTSSCRCECCIEDADIVVYAHCGEVRVVPIEIENDTRKTREDVSLDISDVRTAGGRVLAWPTVSTLEGPLVLDACSTTRFEIAVRVNCRPSDPDDGGDGTDSTSTDKAKAAKAAPATRSRVAGRTDVTATTDSRDSRDGRDIDECIVGYFTVRLGGCLTRPIVVAVAALPYSCDSYRTGCACASCC